MSTAVAPPVALRVEDVSHRYSDELALEHVSLAVHKGEFMTLLGPSGCGKTTLLRIVAGLVSPTAGSVHLHGDDVTRLPPHKRRVNMVFQRVTLFPHLDVFDNVAFGLRLAKVPKQEISTRVRDALALVRLEGFAHRRSDELSGGQAQRVALARALVNRPEVLLLDEPLSALDLRIRLEMEVELRRVHRETGATLVYVTHDQHEALALSDRIAVFDHGRIEQVGTPAEVYRRPGTAFTARFVGDANVLAAEVSVDGSGQTRVVVGGVALTIEPAQPPPAGPAWLVLRQEELSLQASDNGAGPGRLSGVVRDVGFRGSGYTYRIEVPGMPEPLKVEAPAAAAVAPGTAVAVSWLPQAGFLLPR